MRGLLWRLVHQARTLNPTATLDRAVGCEMFGEKRMVHRTVPRVPGRYGVKLLHRALLWKLHILLLNRKQRTQEVVPLDALCLTSHF